MVGTRNLYSKWSTLVPSNDEIVTCGLTISGAFIKVVLAPSQPVEPLAYPQYSKSWQANRVAVLQDTVLHNVLPSLTVGERSEIPKFVPKTVMLSPPSLDE
jgi:hypothetical protein